MIELRDLQVRFTAGILDSDDDSITRHIRANRLTGSRRLQVYRNNVVTGFTEALRAAYPVIERLTGEQFFRGMARAYIASTPSRAGNLHEFGHDFGDFLAGHPACRGFPYFAEVARLEWACHEAWHAGEHEPLDVAKLAEVDAAHYSALVFVLHPTVRLLRARYPVHKIWEVNQPEYPHEPVVDLETGEACILVHRKGWEVQVLSLDAATFVFLDRLSRGDNLGIATEAAIGLDSSFDLNGRLMSQLENRVIVDMASPALGGNTGATATT